MKRQMVINRIMAVILVCVMLLNTRVVCLAGETKNDNKVTVVSVVTNGKTMAALAEDGGLYCWGKNESGQIGNGSDVDQTYPMRIMNNIREIYLGMINIGLYNWGTTAAISYSGDLYCWGDNRYGQVGNGNTDNQHKPVKILENVESVQIVEGCSAAITKTGDLYCWGYNKYGEVGNGNTDNQYEPVKVLQNVKKIIVSAGNKLALTNSGEAYYWGRNETTPVKMLDSVKEIDMSVRGAASVITENGELFCWGYIYDQIGDNGFQKYTDIPIKVLENVDQVVTYGTSRVAVTKTKELYYWGLCLGKCMYTPEIIYSNVKKVALGEQLEVLTDKDELYCCENNQNEILFRKVLENVKDFALEYSYTIALNEKGEIYCWGKNESGQIGNGTTNDQLVPNKILDNINKIGKDVSIYKGSTTSIVIDKEGNLYSWGYNRYGQVGNGTLIDQYTPYKINDIDDELTVDPFDMYLYRSSLLTDPDSKAGPTAEFYINSETPGENMLKQLQKNGFASTSDAWKAVTQTIDLAMDAGKGIDYAFEEKEIYQAILMDSFETSYKLSLVDAINNDIVKDSKELLNIVKLDLKTNFQVDVIESDLLAGWSEDMRKRSLKVMTEYFEEKKLSKFVSSADKVEKILKVPKTFEDMGNQLSTYVNIRYMNDSMKMVMKELYVQCPTENKALRDALQDCISIIDAADKEYEDLLLTSTLKVGGKEAGKAAISWMWDKGIMNAIKLKCPRVIILIAAYKSSKYFTNVMFNTDALTEQYYKMCAVEEIDKLSRKTYDGLKLKYINTRKIDSAQNYLSSIDLAFSIMKLDCDEAIKYIDALDDAALSKVIKLLGKKTGSDSLKRQIESIKKDQEQEYESILYDWLENLKEDYPEQYPNYYYLQAKREKKWKEYTISCPVDVYVYDRDNNLVASVVDNVPSSNEIGVLVDDDEKKLYFDEEDTYHVEYVGNDAGSMSIAITEYGKDNIQLKSVRFDNLPLKKGMVYKSIEDGLYQNMSEYEIENEKGNNLQPDYDSNKETESVKNHVNVENGVLYQDSVPMKEGDIGENEKIMIQATVPVGYEFVRWKVQGDVEIKDNTDEYTSAIMGKKSTTIIAEIREMKQQPDFDEKITEPPYVKTENNTQSILANDTQGTTQNVSVPVPTVSKLKKVKIKAARKGFLLSWKKMKKVSGYQLQISSKKNFKGAKKIAIKKGATNYHTKKLKSKRKYYVRVRAYKTYIDRSGRMQKAYGKWVVVKTKTK